MARKCTTEIPRVTLIADLLLMGEKFIREIPRAIPIVYSTSVATKSTGAILLLTQIASTQLAMVRFSGVTRPVILIVCSL
jgi:hypothetical protein